MMQAAASRVVLGAMRAGAGIGSPGALEDATDWSEVERLTMQNRVGYLVRQGFLKAGTKLPPGFEKRLDEARDAAALGNAANLVTIRTVAPLLRDGGIETVFFKGPLAQCAIYGTHYARVSRDVDILVRGDAFERAKAVLEKAGFGLHHRCRSVWWRWFLGEQTFVNRDRFVASIDLHYRVQQPGGPSLTSTAPLFAQAAPATVGAIEVKRLSDAHACLIACISLVKALQHREPGLSYVADIAAIIRALAPEAMANLHRDAAKMGLRGSLAFGLNAAALMLGGEYVRQPLAGVADEDFVLMIADPAAEGVRWPSRTQLLWILCDSKSDFPREALWRWTSEMCRTLVEPIPAGFKT